MVGGGLSTVTVTPELVADPPEAGFPMAFRVCWPERPVALQVAVTLQVCWLWQEIESIWSAPSKTEIDEIVSPDCADAVAVTLTVPFSVQPSAGLVTATEAGGVAAAGGTFAASSANATPTIK